MLPPVRTCLGAERRILAQQLAQGLNAPLTTSMGRLFDAVASLVGLRHEVNYEGQAAIELEAIANPEEAGAYAFAIVPTARSTPVPVISAIIHDALRRHPCTAHLRPLPPRSGGHGDGGLPQGTPADHGAHKVVLSGGVWQNRLLLRQVVTDLFRREFEVIVHRQVPANDGGLALGQAVIAGARAAAGLVPAAGGC